MRPLPIRPSYFPLRLLVSVTLALASLSQLLFHPFPTLFPLLSPLLPSFFSSRFRGQRFDDLLRGDLHLEENAMARRSGPIVLSCESASSWEGLKCAADDAVVVRVPCAGGHASPSGETASVSSSARCEAWRARWLGPANGAERLAERRARARRRPSRRNRSAPSWRWPASGRRQAGFRSASGALATWRARRCGAASTSISPRSVGRFLKRIRPQTASRAPLAHA